MESPIGYLLSHVLRIVYMKVLHDGICEVLQPKVKGIVELLEGGEEVADLVDRDLYLEPA